MVPCCKQRVVQFGTNQISNRIVYQLQGLIQMQNGASKSKGWIFGYKLHMSCSTGKLIVPLSANVRTANVHDSKMYCTLIKSFSGLVENILCDPA